MSRTIHRKIATGSTDARVTVVIGLATMAATHMKLARRVKSSNRRQDRRLYRPCRNNRCTQLRSPLLLLPLSTHRRCRQVHHGIGQVTHHKIVVGLKTERETAAMPSATMAPTRTKLAQRAKTSNQLRLRRLYRARRKSRRGAQLRGRLSRLPQSIHRLCQQVRRGTERAIQDRIVIGLTTGPGTAVIF